jgi:inward rectifier potassium channel
MTVKRRYRKANIVIDTTSPLKTSQKMRMVPRVQTRDAQDGLLRVGLSTTWRNDLYHRGLTLSWRGFILVATAVYLAANLIFALLYLAQPGSIANAQPGSLLDAFFFSVETFATIGYGVLYPATPYSNAIMTLEALTGIMLVALTTGMMFSRVSRPTARVLFSKIAVVAPHDGKRTMMVRMGNERRSQILQAEVTMTLIRNERTVEGTYMRRFYDLKLERSRTPIFAMSFLVMHVIDETSPLFGATKAKLEEQQAEVLVSVTGLDETSSQIVHARVSYLPSEVRLGHRYADIFGITEDGRRAIDYRRFHDSEPVPEDAPATPEMTDPVS